MKALFLSSIAIVTVALALVTLPADVGPGRAGPGIVSAGSSLPGDANCDGTVDAIDATWVLWFSAGLLGVLPCAENGDVNGDGGINALDAVGILQFVAGLLNALGPSQPPTATPIPTNTALPTSTPLPPTSTPPAPTDTPVPAADLDLSGTWDAHYSLSCAAAFSQEATELSAAVDCGAGAAGTLEGSFDEAAGTFSLSGQIGLFTASFEGIIVDGDSLSGTFSTASTLSAVPLAEGGTFEAVRVNPGGTELTGEWDMTLEDVFSGGCTIEIEQADFDLTAGLDCDSFGITLEGALDGRAVTLEGSLTAFVGAVLFVGVTVSDDGDSVEGTWRISPPGITGSFTATRRAEGAGNPPQAEVW